MYCTFYLMHISCGINGCMLAKDIQGNPQVEEKQIMVNLKIQKMSRNIVFVYCENVVRYLP